MGFERDKNLFYVHGVGVDLSSFEAPPAADGIRRELGLAASDVVVTCVAEMNLNKNHDFLLEGWKGVAGGHPYCHLLLVGTGELKSSLEEKVKREQIPRVHFLGFRQDAPEILRDSDIVTLTSKREGLPRCVMEAMAAGKPVVATDVRGSRDLVEDGRTGFSVRLGDMAGLAAALERLAREPELHTSMGAAGREKIREYSLERVLAEMAEVYGRYLR